jgi:alkanesulfonate monooxygenase SsuD/methylene tetrahydromethanopterin reductase-like flavin-dependent oxidoreductase (luciferase family)
LQIGIDLPSNIPGAKGDFILDWARKADAGPFSSIGVIDRITFDNYEPMVTLAAAASVTKRVRLVTNILMAPLRNAGILAKQAASVDALSNGRLTLGLAVGRRAADFKAAPADSSHRGKFFDGQLETMKRIWSGESLADDIGPIGPAPVQKGGPEIYIGGTNPAAIARVGRWADGYIAGSGSAENAGGAYKLAEDSWKANGRSGKPKFMCVFYFALGDEAAEFGPAYVLNYYKLMGAAAEPMAKAVPTTVEQVKEVIKAREAIGMDEIMFMPTRGTMDQMERLADIVGSL